MLYFLGVYKLEIGDCMEYADLVWDYDEKRRKAFLENLAPIVLFTYNRLDHTKKTIEALQANVYAEYSRLYIYSDGPKNKDAEAKVQLVRNYLHTVIGFKEVNVIERDRNWGLADNIIDGVTKIVHEYGKIIVLEDDIVTSKYFLKYMNDALEIYKDEPKVMEVSGYMYPLRQDDDLPETWFVHRFADCWGWATWARSWQYFERNPQKLIMEFSKEDIKVFNFDGKYDFWQQVVANAEGKLYTWAVFWQATVYKNDGYMLVPTKSMTQNIGFDDSGEHCSSSNVYDVEIMNQEVSKYPLLVEECFMHRKIFASSLDGNSMGLYEKVRKFIKRLL